VHQQVEVEEDIEAALEDLVLRQRPTKEISNRLWRELEHFHDRVRVTCVEPFRIRGVEIAAGETIEVSPRDAFGASYGGFAFVIFEDKHLFIKSLRGAARIVEEKMKGDGKA
jgi:hypothetical protein